MFRTLLRPTPFFESPGAPGGGTAAPPAIPAAPASPATPPPPAPATPSAPAPTSTAPGAPAATPSAREQQLEKDLEAARREAAGYRTQNKGQLAEIRKALGPLLGLEPGAEAPADAASLLAQLQERDNKREKQLRELQLSNALTAAGAKHGADMDLLIPHLRGSAALEKLDLSSENFAKDVSEMVKGLLEKNPKLRATQVAARSTVDPGGAPANVPQLTREQLKGMTPEQINEAREKGQLANLLAGR